MNKADRDFLDGLTNMSRSELHAWHENARPADVNRALSLVMQAHIEHLLAAASMSLDEYKEQDSEEFSEVLFPEPLVRDTDPTHFAEAKQVLGQFTLKGKI
jgi:hypothetical protein